MVGRFTASCHDVAGIGYVCIMSERPTFTEIRPFIPLLILIIVYPLTVWRLLNKYISVSAPKNSILL